MLEVLISGAGSGIGAATAQIFSKNGWKVHLLGRNQQKLEKQRDLIGSQGKIIACDLGNSQSQDLQLPKLKELNISCLVNNAGIYQSKAFADEPMSNWYEQFQTNLFGAVWLTKTVWSQLTQNKGTVTNVSSTLGLRPIENTSAYSATKAAMNSWTQSLALEAGPLGIRVNAICPGLTDTPIHFFHKSDKPEHQSLKKMLSTMQPIGRMGTPEEVAESIYFVSSQKATWMTGALLPVDGGVVLTTRDPK